ncbi:MAG: heme-dependent peroxidase [Firmicutes bacterium]|nr:heme-dependent peroxidase [Bacillota bacterium]
MAEPVETIEGWYELHDFRTVNWSKWQQLEEAEKQQALSELLQLIDQWQEIDAAETGASATFRIIGHKADLLFFNMRESIHELMDVEEAINKRLIGTILDRSYSYFSAVELGTYSMRGLSMEQALQDQNIRRLLHPPVKNWDYLCFYPMTKRRQGEDNWYMLPKEDRSNLMRGHGKIGAKYSDRLKQIIGGSQGIDDWEWGVTLLAQDPLLFKKIVYEMRFDETSARYADFGNFYIGERLHSDQEIAAFFTVIP